MVDALLVLYSAGKSSSSQKGSGGIHVAGSIAEELIEGDKGFVGTSRGLGKHSMHDNSEENSTCEDLEERSDNAPAKKKLKNKYLYFTFRNIGFD